jgi:hypothetical protein
MRWKDIKKTVDDMVAKGIPIKLTADELNAVYDIARTTHIVINSVEIEKLNKKFRMKERKVYSILKNALGTFVRIIDVKLRKEVGEKLYDSCFSPFYITSIRVDSGYNQVTLHGYYLTGGNEFLYESEPYSLTDIKKGKFVITPCKVSKSNLKQAHKQFELNGLAVLPTCWV